MVDQRVTEVPTFIKVDVPKESYIMRFGDLGADPISITLNNPNVNNTEWVRDEQSGVRKPPKREKTLNVHFSQQIPEGSIVDFGPENRYLIVAAPNKEISTHYPGIYAIKIPEKGHDDANGQWVEGFDSVLNRYQKEDRLNMIYSMEKGNIPLTDATIERLNN